MIDFTKEPVRAYPKSEQVRKKRIRPTQKQLGAISPQVRAEVKLRSGGVCERCKQTPAVHMAHLRRRTQLTSKTTTELIAHLCVPCHVWADTSGYEGREWLKEFKERLTAPG